MTKSGIMKTPHSTAFDIVIIGGGLSAIAAAHTACTAGLQVCIVEPSPWLGGQMTSQGVSALDEHPYIETWPGNRTYAQLRDMIRRRMATLYGITPTDWMEFNPGNAWVSTVCFFPHVAVAAIDELLAPAYASGKLTVLTNTSLVAVHNEYGWLKQLTVASPHTAPSTLQARVVIEASDAGDVLALAGLRYVTGAEAQADTGEADAPSHAKAGEIQSFTFGFAVEYCPGEYHRIAKPEAYATLRDRQPFSLTLYDQDGTPRPFRMFSDGPTGLPPFWTYRRLWDGTHTQPPSHDIALINWNSNDYHFGCIIDVPASYRAATIDEAKRLSLAFLYWLQTEVPRDDGGFGYPELKLRPDIMGSNDGLSLVPYVRESRRSPGITRILANEILVSHQPLARARAYVSSVGVGWYHMDLHPAPGNMRSMFAPTQPFQIPMGALLPPDCHNLLLANKTIATTHLSNGAYRLHPIEWQIGTACAAMALVALRHAIPVTAVYHELAHQEAVQSVVLAAGQALAWAVDVPIHHPAFRATQWLILWGVLYDGARATQLQIDLATPLSQAEYARLQAVLVQRNISVTINTTMSWETVCTAITPYLP